MTFLVEEQHGDFLVRFVYVKGSYQGEVQLDGQRVVRIDGETRDHVYRDLLEWVASVNTESMRAELTLRCAEKLAARRVASLPLHKAYLEKIHFPYRGAGVYRKETYVAYPTCWAPGCKETLDTDAGARGCMACGRHICLSCGTCMCGHKMHHPRPEALR